MFLKILGKSLAKRKSRVIIATLAVMMSAAIASTLFSISSTIEAKIGEEFRKFGANIIVLPRSDTIEVGLPGLNFGSVTEQGFLNETDLWKIKDIANWSANVLGYAPFLYQVVSITSDNQTRDVILSGTYFQRNVPQIIDALGNTWVTGLRRIVSWWEVQGEWVESENDTTGSMIGITVAEKLNLNVGSIYNITYMNPGTGNSTSHSLEVLGIITTGGSEDAQIFVNLEVAQAISDRFNKVHTVQVSGLCVQCPAEWIAAEIEAKLPYVQAKSVKQLVNAERAMMEQFTGLLLLVTILTVGASVLGVMATFLTTVIERKGEIGLMKAIGAENRKVAQIFLSEALLIGFIGGSLGYVIGSILSIFVGQSVFSTTLFPDPMSSFVIFLIALGISAGIVLVASLLPVKRAVGIEPAIVMRGD